MSIIIVKWCLLLLSVNWLKRMYLLNYFILVNKTVYKIKNTLLKAYNKQCSDYMLCTVIQTNILLDYKVI